MCMSGWGGRGLRRCLSRRECMERGEIVGCCRGVGWSVGNIVHWCFDCWKEGFCQEGESGTGLLKLLK